MLAERGISGSRQVIFSSSLESISRTHSQVVGGSFPAGEVVSPGARTSRCKSESYSRFPIFCDIPQDLLSFACVEMSQSVWTSVLIYVVTIGDLVPPLGGFTIRLQDFLLKLQSARKASPQQSPQWCGIMMIRGVKFIGEVLLSSQWKIFYSIKL